MTGRSEEDPAPERQEAERERAKRERDEAHPPLFHRAEQDAPEKTSYERVREREGQAEFERSRLADRLWRGEYVSGGEGAEWLKNPWPWDIEGGD